MHTSDSPQVDLSGVVLSGIPRLYDYCHIRCGHFWKNLLC